MVSVEPTTPVIINLTTACTLVRPFRRSAPSRLGIVFPKKEKLGGLTDLLCPEPCGALMEPWSMFVFLHPITGGALRSPELTIYYYIEGGSWRREGKNARSLRGKGEGAKKRDVQNVRLIMTRLGGNLFSSTFFLPRRPFFCTPLSRYPCGCPPLAILHETR